MTYAHVAWKGGAFGALLLALAGCPSDPAPTVDEPPTATPTASAKPPTCDGPPKLNDASNVTHFPPKAGGFCLDPNGSDRGYGEGAKGEIGEICQLFDGECSIYQQHGAKRVVELRYVDGEGTGSTIDVKMTMFRDPGAAYAMFTRRVVGDGDPAHPDSAKPIEGGGRAALGWGNAFLWRGAHMVEIMLNDMSGASDKQVKAKADELLPSLVAAVGKKLPGERTLPPSAAALPTEEQLPLGVRYLTKKIAGVEGTGEGAFGYYRHETRRWRVLSIAKSDEAQAKDVLASFRRVEGAVEEDRLGDGAYRMMLDLGGAQTEWVIARKGSRLVGVGDEPRVLRRGLNPEEHKKRTLSLDDKRARVKALLEE